MIRWLRVARASAVKARTQAINALKALLVTAPEELREQLRGLSRVRLVRSAAELEPGPVTTPVAAATLALRTLARRYQALSAEMTIVISHGHVDHHGGLEGLAARTGRRRLPLLIHPGAWRERKITFPTGAELHLPPPSRADLEAEGLEVVEERGPTLLLDGQVLISGGSRASAGSRSASPSTRRGPATAGSPTR
jgi:glyoxylase-like metal-dependent hydrolase (beta-lactamase superfamily II)